jgi:hypothetical protein
MSALKQNSDESLSNFAFKFNMWCHTKVRAPDAYVATLLAASCSLAHLIRQFISLGRAVQVDSINTSVESAYGFSACNWSIINCFQRLLSVSTCAATPGPEPRVAVGGGGGVRAG